MIPVNVKLAVAKDGGYLEHQNLEAELKTLSGKVEARMMWVRHLGGRTKQPFALVIPSGWTRPAWANLVTGTLHDPTSGRSLSGDLKIQFHARN